MNISRVCVIVAAALLVSASWCPAQVSPEGWDYKTAESMRQRMGRLRTTLDSHIKGEQMDQVDKLLKRCQTAVQTAMKKRRDRLTELGPNKPDLSPQVRSDIARIQSELRTAEQTAQCLTFLETWYLQGGAKLPSEEKVQAMRKGIDPAKPGAADRAHMLAGNFFAPVGLEEYLALLGSDLPADIRGVLASSFLYTASQGLRTVNDAVATYEGLMLHAWDTPAAAKVLEAYIGRLDWQNATATADQTLETYVELFHDTDLGAAAARMRLGSLPTKRLQDATIERFTKRFPNSAVSRELLPFYVAILAERGEIDPLVPQLSAASGIALDDVGDSRQYAANMLALVRWLEDLDCPPIQMRGKTQAEAIRQPANTENLPLVLAREALAKGKPVAASHLALWILQQNPQPMVVDLMSGAPFASFEQLGDMSQADQAQQVGALMVAAASYDLTRKIPEALMPSDIAAASPGIQPYWHALVARQARDAGNHAEALKQVQQARAALPISVPLARLHAELLEAQFVAEAKSHIDAKRQALLAPADDGSPADASSHRAAARLYLATEGYEQAIGVLQDYVRQNPDHVSAPGMLLECIDVIEQARDRAVAAIKGNDHQSNGRRRDAAKPYDERARAIQDRLLNEYSQSLEADAVRRRLVKQAS
jgi:hypothetical protein